MTPKDSVAFGLEDEIKNNSEHYNKLKKVVAKGKALLNSLLQKGDKKEIVDIYKKILHAYDIMGKFIDAVHKSK